MCRLQSTVSSLRPITLARRPTMAGKNFCNALKWFRQQMLVKWEKQEEEEGQLADQLYR